MCFHQFGQGNDNIVGQVTDTIHNITVDPILQQELDNINAVVLEQEDAEIQQTLSKTDAQNAASTKKSISIVADTVKKPETHVRHGIIMMAPHGKQQPVSPHSVGSTATSWVILGLVAVFLLVSLRYARNFKFLSALGADLLSRQPKKKMFDDTVRERSFLVFLNILCIVSIGVLLYTHIEIQNPALRDNSDWYSALAATSALVGAYYLLQWLAYYVIGKTFASDKDAASWMRGFSAGQGILGLVLFPIALISVFYARDLYLPVILGACAYVLMRVIFICKGFRIFSRNSISYLTFFYYLCTLEIAPVVLILALSTHVCTAVAGV